MEESPLFYKCSRRRACYYYYCVASCFVDYSTIVCINCSNTTRTCIIQFAAELILIRSCGTTYYPFCKEVQHASFSLRYIQAREILSTRVLWASLMSRNLKPAVAPQQIHSSTNFVKISSSCWSSEAATYMTKSYYN
jgi:hypothetical protein